MGVSTRPLRLLMAERERLVADFNGRMLAGGVVSVNEARGLSVYRPVAHVHGVMLLQEPLGRRPWPRPAPAEVRVASRHAVVSRAGFGGGFPRSAGVWS